MELLDLIKSRKSIRKYKKQSITLEKIYSVLDAGRYAPSGANQQPWTYILVTDTTLKQQIRKEAEREETKYHKTAPSPLKEWFKKQGITPAKPFLTDAPALIVVASDTKAPYWLESTWISIAYILLQAENQKLGTLTYTPSDTAFLNKLLNIPNHYSLVAIIPIGYPAETPTTKTRPRKPLKQIVHHNKYSLK
ncbi:MAG: nitroreductase family protein [Candidatus Bathyarchaeota archaeon]|nr:nitroreductase family protein [Candidatus Bathyarchaeota archaeon]MDH5732343.1 nitroreductase family protein [Candidatus Bathyarchaeota archaeon]